ncbi:hypothetical protein ESA94_02685 [Lacibacter luteus]|uniref:Ppx/GppA phosphatase domain-containing protein n=1 Tax=Lacibacter luteus TaxID=2508719 RepID=A0A4Q1CLQ8_9BACT|nr:hypothetical protein [Lacibacter luteus]RXK61936.1 hypothetical protein ESA94_02685 [Lacibacter luteus]
MVKTKARALLAAFLFITAFVAAQTSVNRNIKIPNLYAGIEVGSKGVKMSLIEFTRSAETGNSFAIVKDTSINTDFISFTPATFDATLNGLTALFNAALTKYNIPTKRVFTVVSSGVKQQAEKEKKTESISKLISAFQTKINEPGRLVDVVDVMDEAKLSHQGIVPLARRYNTFLIDIGSGNTKGGFFPYGNDSYFYLFQLNWGTKSTANAADKLCGDDKSLQNYSKQLLRVAANAEAADITYAVNTSGSYPVSDHIAFSGGIAWATATLLYPELSNNPIIPVTYEDVERFTKRVSDNFSSLSEAYLVGKLGNGKWNKKQISDEVKRVHSVFDQKSLMAGSALLLRIMRQFKSVNEAKQFYLIKNGQVGWVSAYVTEATD